MARLGRGCREERKALPLLCLPRQHPPGATHSPDPCSHLLPRWDRIGNQQAPAPEQLRAVGAEPHVAPGIPLDGPVNQSPRSFLKKGRRGGVGQ